MRGAALVLLLVAQTAALMAQPTAAVYKRTCEERFPDQYAVVKAKMQTCEDATKITMALPLTVKQKQALCSKCTDLAEMTQADNWPACTVVSEGVATNLRVQFRNFFRPCLNATTKGDSDDGSGDGDGATTTAPASKSPAGATTITKAPATTKTPSSSPAAPKLSSPDDANAKQTTEASTDSAMSAGVVIGVIAGVVAVLLVALLFVLVRRRRQRSEAANKLATVELDSSTGRASTNHQYPFSLVSGSTRSKPSNSKLSSSQLSASAVQANLWEDEVIIAARIPKDKVVPTVLISRGGYGEVYQGIYNRQPVAIKTLLPEKRKDLREINAFLYEVKLMASLEHERIVTFIGVAWDSLNDICAVSELMEGGDLRSILVQFDRLGRRRGFDSEKIRIALHVAHALTYLHSLRPIVLHRDLKSKNILLDSHLNAKVTDFGVSRERSDTTTMTAGVGTSLWMAPEVMLGERYDDKADVFSFGVVLSELDTHSVPYGHVKETNSGRRIPDSAVLQMVSLGRLRVHFTVEDSIPEMIDLGNACVALNPKDRPSAADALYTIHNILKSMFRVL